MPAALYLTLGLKGTVHPPSRKQSASMTGSPHGASMTYLSFLKVFARLAQKAGEWSASGAAGWYVAFVVPGAAHIRDSSAYMLCRWSRLTYLTIARPELRPPEE